MDNESQPRAARSRGVAIPWEWLVAARGWPNPKRRHVKVYVCESRSGVMRERHELDKDGRCIFCAPSRVKE